MNDTFGLPIITVGKHGKTGQLNQSQENVCACLYKVKLTNNIADMKMCFHLMHAWLPDVWVMSFRMHTHRSPKKLDHFNFLNTTKMNRFYGVMLC